MIALTITSLVIILGTLSYRNTYDGVERTYINQLKNLAYAADGGTKLIFETMMKEAELLSKNTITVDSI